ncbi:bestrophin, RFP-TM, chloride channel domain-containing protein [Ditylenchus destructor]|uniref:Bestrophin homolog n=1 Tax=Ditylenchus destructor TaxID=166010 RepID=A0AAD4N6H6_9BILA|nr:bestrophin, RFP-TM, chloride channel domain-containing protein [Ditylenchus destructor]
MQATNLCNVELQFPSQTNHKDSHSKKSSVLLTEEEYIAAFNAKPSESGIDWLTYNMSVSYHLDVATTGATSFLNVLFRWHGSVWKRALAEMILWLGFYWLVALIYHSLMTHDAQLQFETIARYLDTNLIYFPMNLILGFFVVIVFKRWEGIFQNIGFIDECAYFVSSYIPGRDEEIITIRRNILRYLCLTQVLVLRDVSVRVRTRFPNITCVEDAGYLNAEEKDLLLKNGVGYDRRYWIPMAWAIQLVEQMLERKAINQYQSSLLKLLSYDWLPIPLAYCQAVFVLVRASVIICLFARQILVSSEADALHSEEGRDVAAELVIPFMTILQVFFYLAWAKVTEEMLNPLGESDSHFESNYIIDRNLSLAMQMADRHAGKFPEQCPDSVLHPTSLNEMILKAHLKNKYPGSASDVKCGLHRDSIINHIFPREKDGRAEDSKQKSIVPTP